MMMVQAIQQYNNFVFVGQIILPQNYFKQLDLFIKSFLCRTRLAPIVDKRYFTVMKISNLIQKNISLNKNCPTLPLYCLCFLDSIDYVFQLIQQGSRSLKGLEEKELNKNLK